MTGRWVVLEPLDVVTVRDGRAFDMGVDAVGRMALPSPATFAGAIGAAYGAAPGLARKDPGTRGALLPAQVHGPVVVRRDDDSGWEAMLPVPADVLLSPDGEPYRLAADRQLAGVEHDLDSQVAMLLTGAEVGGASAEDRWWDAGQLQEYLDDGEVSGFWLPDPWQVERRVGIARGDDRTVTEGMFYSSEYLRAATGVGFAGRCIGGPDRALGGTVPFGGKGRRAEVHAGIADVGLPAAPTQFPGGRLLLYLATPAVFPGGSWHPDLSAWPAECGTAELAAAAVGATRVITTGTPDRKTGSFGSGAVMWAVPAGSVYYLRLPDEATARAAAAHLHGTTLRQAEDWMTTAGFGLVLAGRWTEG